MESKSKKINMRTLQVNARDCVAGASKNCK